MTDKELIQAARTCQRTGGCGRCTLFNECPGRAAYLAMAADSMEALLAENEHLREVTKMVPKWVSVEERLPESDGKYLVLIESGDVFEVEFDTDYGDNGEFGVTQAYYHPDTLGFLGSEWTCIDTVTHWMIPLPEPPSTEGVE